MFIIISDNAIGKRGQKNFLYSWYIALPPNLQTQGLEGNLAESLPCLC